MIGGYKVLDFKGIDISTTVIVPGVYSVLEASVGKPILIRNLKNKGIEIPAFFTTCYFESTYVVLMRMVTTTHIHRIYITDGDRVTYQTVLYATSSSPANQDEPTASM